MMKSGTLIHGLTDQLKTVGVQLPVCYTPLPCGAHYLKQCEAAVGEEQEVGRPNGL